ncbi:MAG TPA: PhoH family protein [Coprothermobacter proteolyticus]|nr:PhoH family protein [Coprothermobacter proteolyticus]
MQPTLREKKPRAIQHKNKEHLEVVKKLKPLNEAQRQMIHSFKEGFNVVAFGSAGSGKSYVACSLALEELFSKQIDKIVIVRSAVQVRDVGFMPGDLHDKALAYTIPYKQIINDICQNGTAWDILSKKGMVEFITTSFVRGITLDDCVVIVDEVQSMNAHEIDSIVTRVGKNCTLVICGDTRQNDLIKHKGDKSGFEDALEIFKKMSEDFECVQFFPQDIVRSGLVKRWILTKEELGL